MLSRNAINRLGDAIRSGQPISSQELLYVHQEHSILCSDIRRLNQLKLLRSFPEFSIYARVKTLKSRQEKLRRQPTLQYARMDDVVGLRIVGDFGLEQQDLIVQELHELFDIRQVKDRRLNPIAGYRAVHAIARAEQIHMEIQVRTLLQDEWAYAFESACDAWGRQIRYGEPPSTNAVRAYEKQISILNDFQTLSLVDIATFEETETNFTSESAGRNEILTAIVNFRHKFKALE